MGFGFRGDIINRKETENMPSPLNYEHSSIFEDNFKYNKGFSLSNKLPYKVNFLKNFIIKKGRRIKKLPRAIRLR
jgi:hypothetical protein